MSEAVFSKNFNGALTDADGTIRHFINGAYGREDDLPCVEYADGKRCWYTENPKRGGFGQPPAVPHRAIGPAIVHADGRETYYVMGKLHRLDGPAHVTDDGIQKWFVDDKFVKAVFPSGRVALAP